MEPSPLPLRKELQTDPKIDPAKCYLLSLPKELRLEIWEYVLTDPSLHELVVGIKREPQVVILPRPQSVTPSIDTALRTRQSAPYPTLITSLVNPRNVPINVNLLRTNRFIYYEALPTLYHSVKFAPLDLEGVFPLFLQRLSPYARSHIRYIKLDIPHTLEHTGHRDYSKLHFHWPITCAQVAKLGGTLRQVDIDGWWLNFRDDKLRKLVLYPLCKIKTPKKLVRGSDESFKMALAEAEKELKAKALIRKQRAEAEALERAKREAEKKETEASESHEKVRERLIYTFTTPDVYPGMTYGGFCILDSNIDKDLDNILGIEQFEKELDQFTKSPTEEEDSQSEDDYLIEEWEVVPVSRVASTLKARESSSSLQSHKDHWSDTASTVLAKNDGENLEDTDSIRTSWELVEK